MTSMNNTPSLVEPVSLQPLRREGDAYVGDNGQRYEIEGRIVRVLRNVNPELARELESQAIAADDYGDPRFLMPRYERDMAELALVRLFGGQAPKGDVLDAGCGIGILGRLFPDMGLVGLDASVDLLRRVATGYRLLVEASAESLPFPDRSFDVVVALNMLHHVIDPAQAVREFARVLRPGGSLVAVDPRKVWPVEVAKRVLRGNDQSFAPTHKAFGVQEYASLIERQGLFQIDESQRVGLLTLLAVGGLDATKLSFKIDDRDRLVNYLRGADQMLFKVPGVSKLGLNLAVRARRAAS